MFTLNSDITIGNFRFSGVHEVVVRRSVHSITDTATISLPSQARIPTQGGASSEPKAIMSLFKDGDPVTIKLGYNGNLTTEFEGFVQRREMDTRTVVHCKGYSVPLDKGRVTISADSITLADLLKVIQDANLTYPIQTVCEADVTFSNIRFTGTALGLLAAIGEWTDHALTFFFPTPKVLWGGFLYTALANGNRYQHLVGNTAYRHGYNTLAPTNLKPKLIGYKTVAYANRTPSGNLTIGKLGKTKNGEVVKPKILNHVNTETDLRQLAMEKAYSANYSGMEGSLLTFLEPYAAPGGMARLQIRKYPDANGDYLVTSVETTFGILGARRKVELGAKFGFKKP
jgi:hypothetical protein